MLVTRPGRVSVGHEARPGEYRRACSIHRRRISSVGSSLQAGCQHRPVPEINTQRADKQDILGQVMNLHCLVLAARVSSMGVGE